MRQALSDIIVVELATEPAGAYCGKVFADLGADVVMVEPPAGSPLRRRPGAFLHLHTNKRSIAVDPADAAGRARVDALLARADLVVESGAAGDLAAWGIDRSELRERHPALVVATISGFGTDGPYAAYRWSDLVAQAAGWATLPQGPSEAVPVKLPATVALHIVGHTAAVGALAGVMRARAAGAGAHVDCAAYEALGAAPSRAGRYLGWEYKGRETAGPIAANPSAILFPIGVFPCADGHVALMSTPQQLHEMLAVLDDDDLRAAFAYPDAMTRGETKEILDAALYPWLLSHTRAELTAVAQAAGWPFAGVNAPAEVLGADHLHQRGYWVETVGPAGEPMWLPGPPYRLAEGGWRFHRGAPALAEDDVTASDSPVAPAPARARGPADPGSPPLRGIRVLDLTTVWSGPFLTLLLADLGAEVIRLENPSVFPPTTKGYVPRPADIASLGHLLGMYAPAVEGRPDRPYNRHAMNNSIARNKLSCTLDPRRPEGRDLLLRLVEQSDVFVENLKTSALHRMGIHESELLERNPRLIVVRVPPAGLTGDWAHYSGFGAQFDGLSGLAWITGHHDSELVDTPATTYMDAATGPAGAFAVLAALHYREGTGRGQLVEVAQIENVIAHLGDVYADLQLGIEPRRFGNRDAHRAPQGIYRARGECRWLALTVDGDEAWAALAALMGRAELASDARFSRADARLAHVDDLDGVVGAWVAEQDVVEAFHALQAAGIAAAPVLDEALLAADPNVAHRGWLRPLASTDVGSFLHTGPAFAGVPQAWDRGAPVLGEDNEYVFKKVLGLDDDTYRALAAAGVIVDDYLDADGNPL